MPAPAMTPVVTAWRREAPVVVSVAEPNSPACGTVPVAAHLAAVRPAGTQAAQPDGHQPGDQRRARPPPWPTSASYSPRRASGCCSSPPTCAVPGIGEFFQMEERVGLDPVPARPADAEGERATRFPASSTSACSRPGRARRTRLNCSTAAGPGICSRRCAERYDLVLIDTPPVLPVTDAAILAQHADATLPARRGRARPGAPTCTAPSAAERGQRRHPGHRAEQGNQADRPLLRLLVHVQALLSRPPPPARLARGALPRPPEPAAAACSNTTLTDRFSGG